MAKHPNDNRGIDFPPNESVSFDIEAFDEALRSQGVKFVHYRAMRCPVGLVDKNDTRRPAGHEGHVCSNGYLYTRAGEITTLFTSNSNEKKDTGIGSLDGATVQVTFPRTYDDQKTPFSAVMFDRLFLSEPGIVVPTWQLFEAHASGKDRLQFAVEEVQDLVDADGNIYNAGDFTIEKGCIVWGARRPRFDQDTRKGVVCSVRYLYRPFWYVSRLVHEVRVAQVEDGINPRHIERFPYAMQLQREYVFEKEQIDEQPAANNPRQGRAPESGSFGPR